MIELILISFLYVLIGCWVLARMVQISNPFDGTNLNLLEVGLLFFFVIVVWPIFLILLAFGIFK